MASGVALTIDDFLLKRTVELFDYSPHILGEIVNKIEFIDETTLYINSLIDQVNQIESLVYQSANRILSQYLVDGTLTIAVQNVVSPLTQPIIDDLNAISNNLTTVESVINTLANNINNLSNAVASDTTTINNLQTGLATLQTNINTALNNLNSLIDLVATLIENFSSLLMEVNTINSQLTLLSGYPFNVIGSQLTTIETSINTINTFITNANQELTTNLASLATYQTQITTNTTNITPLDSSITAIVNSTADWVDTVSSMITALSVISGDFDDTNTAVSTENQNLATVQTDYNNALTNHNNNITANQTNINNLNNLLNIVTMSNVWTQESATTTLNNGNTVTGTCDRWLVAPNVYHVLVRFTVSQTLGQNQFNLNFPGLRQLIPSNPNWSGQLTTSCWFNHVSNTSNNNFCTFNINWANDNMWFNIQANGGAPAIGTGIRGEFYIFEGMTPESVAGSAGTESTSDAPYYI